MQHHLLDQAPALRKTLPALPDGSALLQAEDNASSKEHPITTVVATTRAVRVMLLICKASTTRGDQRPRTCSHRYKLNRVGVLDMKSNDDNTS
jgi:hypothetical protein